MVCAGAAFWIECAQAIYPLTAEHSMKITIVTPSFNRVRFIERTILSVLSQDWPQLEYVVFDGGSADETVNIPKKYNGRIRWVSHPDGGQADAVNKGIASTDREIIGRLNSDDIYHEGAVRRAVEYL
jgi:glycosyltransferase involved in cell wall biosynthesis